MLWIATVIFVKISKDFVLNLHVTVICDLPTPVRKISHHNIFRGREWSPNTSTSVRTGQTTWRLIQIPVSPLTWSFVSVHSIQGRFPSTWTTIWQASGLIPGRIRHPHRGSSWCTWWRFYIWSLWWLCVCLSYDFFAFVRGITCLHIVLQWRKNGNGIKFTFTCSLRLHYPFLFPGRF